VIPDRNTYVPIWFIPVAGDAAVVAPVIAQVSVIVQLSAITASGTVTLAEQEPASAFWEMFPEQVIVGTWLSVTVTVKLHVEMFPAASVAV
jgi:hypothetical protein